MGGETGEGDDVADVFHAGGEKDEPLEAGAEARMRDRAIFAKLRVPPVIFWIEFMGDDFLFEQVQTLFALAAPDHFADFWHKHIHGRNSLVVVVRTHVEGFDFLRVVGEDDRLFAIFFREVPLVLRLKIGAPVDGDK